MRGRQYRSGPSPDGRSAGQLRRSVRILSDLGIKTIILVADHGHLFADEIGEDMKIEAPEAKRKTCTGASGLE